MIGTPLLKKQGAFTAIPKSNFGASAPAASAPSGGGAIRDVFSAGPGSMLPPDSNQSNMGSSALSSPIEAPRRTTIADAYNNIRQFLPQYTPVQGIENVFNDDYYKNLENQATKRLNEQFFSNDNSVANQFKNTMAKRGLIGSGIEVGGLNDLYKNFGSELSDLQSKLATQKTQNLFETTKYNKDIEKYNIETRNKLAELGLGAAGDEAKTATDYATKMFDSAVKQRNYDQEFISNQIKTIGDALKNELIDPDTRQYFEDLFGTYLGDTFGNSYSQFQAANPKPAPKKVPFGSGGDSGGGGSSFQPYTRKLGF